MYSIIFTISDYFFVNSIFIFHNTKVQIVILRCLMGLNLDWFKSYGLRCSLRLCACSANSQERQLIISHFTTTSGNFFANYMNIFHKTEVQTIILRCLTSLNLNWYKSYDKKCKHAKNVNECFCTKSQKMEMEIFAFCIITFEPNKI